MSNAPLPSQVDVRKLAAKGAEIHAQVPVSSLLRFVDMLADDSSSIAVDLHFYIDEERIRRLDGHLSATVQVYCQRCLEPMPLQLDSRFSLGIVWSEDDAKRLPATLDPLIVGEDMIDLADVVSEELILSMPFVSFHDPEQCRQQENFSTVSESSAAAKDTSRSANAASGEARENPFKVLEQLKRNK